MSTVAHAIKKSERYRPIKDAAIWARLQGVTTKEGWFLRCKDPNFRPADIPSSPAIAYGSDFKKMGGWGGFLGTGAIAPQCRVFRSIEDASLFVQASGVTSQKDWTRKCKKPGFCPTDMPKDPRTAYGQDYQDKGGDGWFFGTGRIAKQLMTFRSLEDCALWARAQGVTGADHWKELCKNKDFRPIDIPYDISDAYGDEFTKMGGWIGFLGQSKLSGKSKIELALNRVLSRVLGFGEKDTHPIRLSCGKACRVDIIDPSRRLIFEYDGLHYHQNSLEKDTLKTENLKNCTPPWKVIRVREDGLALIDKKWNVQVTRKGLMSEKIITVLVHLKGLIEQKLIPDPDGIVVKIDKELSAGIDMSTFSDLFEIGWRPMEKAAQWAQAQGVKSGAEWALRCQDPLFRPSDIPTDPSQSYGKAFLDMGGWGWFLGTNRIANQNRAFLSLEDASAWVQSKGIKTPKEFIIRSKEADWPINMPKSLYDAYGEEFAKIGNSVFFGTGVVSPREQIFCSLEDAMAWAKPQKISSQADWWARCKDLKIPPHIPKNPSIFYKEAFIKIGGWGGFLGTGTIANTKKPFCSVQEAALWAQQQGVLNWNDWQERCKTPNWRPTHIPAAPHKYYKEKFIEFGGWRAFFGLDKPLVINVVSPKKSAKQKI